MQILQVVHALPAATYGGTELYTQWLAEALADEHDVAVATPRGTETSVDGATVYALPDTDGWTDPTGVESGLERSIADDTVDEAFEALLEELEPEVVHFQHLKFTSATLPERCREHGVPALLTLHDFWTRCHREQLQRPDGRHCSGPESVEKCAACYADALERADRRDDGPAGDGTGRDAVDADDSGEPADGEPAESDPVTEPPEPTLLGDRPQDDADDDSYAPPSIDEIDRSEAEEALDVEELIDGQGRSDDTATEPDPFEHSYELDVSDRPDLGLEDLRETVARRTARLDDALEATDLLISPSAFLRDRFVDFGVPAEQIVHCRNGVRVDDYVDTGFDPDGGVALGYAGRLAPEKGVHVLLEAFRTLEGDATLHLFGAFDPATNDYHARLRDAAAGERVTFHGWYEENSTPFERVDALVLPSQWYENSPLVIQEAFASGVPVIAGDDGGMAELVSHGEDGLTYSVGDPVALANCLQTLLDDPASVQRLRDGVEQPTSMAEHARHVEFLYEICAEGAIERAVDVDLPS